MKQNVSKHIKTIFEYWLSNIMYVLQKFLTINTKKAPYFSGRDEFAKKKLKNP